jgi:hypothetical protein
MVLAGFDSCSLAVYLCLNQAYFTSNTVIVYPPQFGHNLKFNNSLSGCQEIIAIQLGRPPNSVYRSFQGDESVCVSDSGCRCNSSDLDSIVVGSVLTSSKWEKMSSRAVLSTLLRISE